MHVLEEENYYKLSQHPYRVVIAVVQLLISKQQRVSNEDEDGSQDEGDGQMNVNVVPGAVQLPEVVRNV